MRLNLSGLAIFGSLSAIIDGVTQYWCGEADWTTDPDRQDVIIRPLASLAEHIKYLKDDHDIEATPFERDHVFQVIEWADKTWVVINPNKGTIHRVFMANVYGQGWYMKNEGSIEKELVIRRNAQSWNHIKFRGDKIQSLEVHLPDDIVTWCGGFNVPSDSNLRFQFEYEAEPYDVSNHGTSAA